jgi:predicted nucleic acid-binding protein
MIIISDTSCITNLFQINTLEILPKLFGKILIPEAVFNELIAFHKNIFATQLSANKIELTKVTDAVSLEKAKKFDLDSGETEAIALALQLKNIALIIDEKEGKKAAEKLGIKTVGLLGIILLAKQKNHIASVKILLDDLQLKTTFHFSDSLYTKIIQLAGK